MNADGNTPLHNAHDAYIADQLIAKGADVNAVNKKGDAPIHTAIMSYHDDVVEILLAYDADKLKVNGTGLTPLQLAKKYEASKIVKLLEE